jgi:hypothetical protein
VLLEPRADATVAEAGDLRQAALAFEAQPDLGALRLVFAGA